MATELNDTNDHVITSFLSDLRNILACGGICPPFAKASRPMARTRLSLHLSLSLYANFKYSGDSHSSPGMLEFMKLIGEVHPGIFIHSIYIYEDQGEDRKAGFVCLCRPAGCPPQLNDCFHLVWQYQRAVGNCHGTARVNTWVTKRFWCRRLLARFEPLFSLVFCKYLVA